MRRATRLFSALPVLCLLAAPAASIAQGDPVVIFAVVTKAPKDRTRVTAQVTDGSTTTEATLLATDQILNNPIWRDIEICHALKAEAWKTAEGYKLDSVKVLDAGMLPMSLQGIAGECLLKKALEVAPMAD